MNISVDIALGDLNKLIRNYTEISQKAPWEALAKHGDELSRNLSRELMSFAPPKGSIKSRMREALLSGEGVTVRESVRETLAAKLGAQFRINEKGREVVMTPIQGLVSLQGARFGKGGKRSFMRGGAKIDGKTQWRRLNFQALAVQREINLRERARGYSSKVARIPGLKGIGGPELSGSASITSFGRYHQKIAWAALTVNPNGAELLIVYGGPGVQSGDALSTQKAHGAVLKAIEKAKQNIVEYLVGKIRKPS